MSRPTKQTAHRCGTCGKLGHNARTCPQKSASPPPDAGSAPPPPDPAPVAGAAAAAPGDGPPPLSVPAAVVAGEPVKKNVKKAAAKVVQTPIGEAARDAYLNAMLAWSQSLREQGKTPIPDAIVKVGALSAQWLADKYLGALGEEEGLHWLNAALPPAWNGWMQFKKSKGSPLDLLKGDEKKADPEPAMDQSPQGIDIDPKAKPNPPTPAPSGILRDDATRSRTVSAIVGG